MVVDVVQELVTKLTGGAGGWVELGKVSQRLYLSRGEFAGGKKTSRRSLN